MYNHSYPVGLELPASALSGLVVDDDPILAEHAAVLLRRYGITDTVVATSVENARNVLAFRKPNLVVCEVHVPDENGFHLLDLLGDICPDAAIIVCSAHSERIVLAATEVARSIGFPWVGHLFKPLAEARLFELLDAFSSQTCVRPSDIPRTLDIGKLATGEFVAWFQPQVCAQHPARLFGLEALVRWRSVDGILHAPSAFLDVVARHGLEAAMLQTILGPALDLLKELRGRWPDLKLSVNVSPTLLANRVAIQALIDACRHQRLPTHALTLELTELPTVDHANWKAMLANAARVRLAGMGLSIDDLGTRESSAERAALLPVSEVKIDKLFVHTARRFTHARAVLRTLRSIAANVGAVTVVEGIESEDDLRMAQDMGFDVVQGFYISWPLAAEEVRSRYG